MIGHVNRKDGKNGCVIGRNVTVQTGLRTRCADRAETQWPEGICPIAQRFLWADAVTVQGVSELLRRNVTIGAGNFNGRTLQQKIMCNKKQKSA